MKDEQFLEEILEYACEIGSFNSRNLIDQAEHVCIWGTGTMFHEAYEAHFVRTGIKVDYLCDNKPEKWGKDYLGIRCIFPAELEQLEHTVIVPLIGKPERIETQLKQMGVSMVKPSRLAWDLIADTPRERAWFRQQIPKIKQVYRLLTDDRSKSMYIDLLCNWLTPERSRKSYEELYEENQYFGAVAEGYRIGKEEILCDVGAYTGDTIENFLNTTNGAFEQIYAFEIEPGLYKQCCQKIQSFPPNLQRKIQCWNLGALDEAKNVFMGWEAHGQADSNGILRAENLKLKEEEKQIGKTVRLEDILEGKPITLLKMDIEGAEQAALQGAQGLIKTEHPPKLAICIYHRLQDMWEIPLYLKQLVPEYRLSIRHHSKEDFIETVCYAYV